MGEDPKGPEKIDISDILEEVEEIAQSPEGLQDGVPVSRDAPPDGADLDAEERILRLRADFENYRRRKQSEMDELRRRASENLVAELLPVLDNLERALQGAPASESDPFRLGVELIQRQILDVLGSAGLQPIEAVGQPFDPEIHEAVARQESDELPPNSVFDQMQAGYRFHGRLLRPSMVRVTSAAGPSADSEPEPVEAADESATS